MRVTQIPPLEMCNTFPWTSTRQIFERLSDSFGALIECREYSS